MTADPLHLDPIVERLAQEAWERANRGRAMNGADAPSHQSSLLCQFTRELVAVVAEECAKIAAGTYEGDDGGGGESGYSGSPYYGENSAAAIRERFKGTT